MAVLFLVLITCKKETVAPPTVKVFDGAITISQTSASVSAEVTDQGGAEVKLRGFVYGLSGGSLDTVYCGSGMGVYSAELTNLQPNTTYVYEAFAKNAGGVGTSGKVTFTTRDNEQPTVKTAEVESVEVTTARCGGNVTNDGGAIVSERGVCWSTSHNPTINDSHVSSGNGLGEYTCDMSDLSVNTTYYVKAYARNSKGTAYGEEKQFTTLDYDFPTVTTAVVTDITQTTAKAGGEVSSDGGAMVTERGICWSSNHNPTVNNHKVEAGQGLGSFTCNFSGMNVHTKYYVRAYATNSKGTAYGNEVSFTTLADVPAVSTGSVTNITTTTATGSGNVTSDGGSTVTERGLCWSTRHDPTISGTHVAADEGMGAFTAAMPHLTPNTTYYVRAYATNGMGTSYGDEVEFATLSISVPGVTTASVANIGNTSATGGGNVISDGGANVTERGICWSTSHSPTISGSHDNNGSGTGNYTVNMIGLTPNTTYYVRAYAINSQGTAYGEEVDFKTSQTIMYTIGVSANPSNGGTVSGGGTFEQGQSCTVSATAATGYSFQKWTENGSQISTNANYTFTVSGSRTLVAQFQAQSYTISVSASPSNGGTVSGAGSYNYGQSCTLTATPATGYTFVKWTKNGTQVSTNASYTFTVTTSSSYMAHFQIVSYSITASANPSSGGSVSGAGSYNYGQNCTLTATPATGYTFVKWTKNGTQVSTNASYAFTVTGSASYVAHFQAISYTISVSVNPSAGGTVSGGGTYTYGQSCTVHAFDNSGYAFTKWTVNGSQVSTNPNYTFTVTGNRNLVANFAQTFPEGAINGLFSISSTQQVYFSQGNLQYNASQGSHQCADGSYQQGTWRFATNQWDCLGYDNAYIGQYSSVWIDLFGWGTSGWDCGNTYYNPWDSNSPNVSTNSLYGPPGQYNLTGNYANLDWGRYNAISNGGNQAGLWRTLTKEEWVYVFKTRNTTSGIRYAKACVNNVNGVIMLPDNWSSGYYSLNSTNMQGVSFNSNIISISQWNTLEQHGAVFLPASGYRHGTSLYSVGGFSYYWSTSCSGNSGAYSVLFYGSGLDTAVNMSRSYGNPVRLVRPAQ